VTRQRQSNESTLALLYRGALSCEEHHGLLQEELITSRRLV